MELQDLKKLAEQGFFTDITAYEYYANNEEELQSLTTAQLAELGFVPQVARATAPEPEEPIEPTEQVTLTFTTSPAEAELTVNSEPCPEKSITVDKDSTVTYTATAEGYDDITDTVQADSTKEVQVTMTKKQYDFTINATPEGATVTINDEVRNILTAPHGTEVRWSVTMDGYTEQSGTETLNDDVTKNIDLIAVEQASIEPMATTSTTSTVSKTKSK